MRHRNSGRKLGRTASHRTALFRNMATSLFRHERITTTEAADLALAVTTVLLVVMDLLVNRVPSTPKTPAKVISQ